MQSPFRSGLLLAATFLGFLGCLMIQGVLPSDPSVADGKAAIGSGAAESPEQIHGIDLTGSNCILTAGVEIALADDDLVFEEESMELCHLDSRECTFRIDQGITGPRFANGAVREIRLDISLPLLV